MHELTATLTLWHGGELQGRREVKMFVHDELAAGVLENFGTAIRWLAEPAPEPAPVAELPPDPVPQPTEPAPETPLASDGETDQGGV